MSFWVLLQVFINVILVAGVVGLWFKLNRPAKDDPRLSRGLQLLQSKISVLEDLSDRTEHQVQQLSNLLEQKAKDVQSHIFRAERQIQNIDNSMNRSLEVAKIFQDKIPHQEIIERQNTVKYVKAARMAHQGASIEEICQAVDLSRGEIEFIAKVNRDQLQFSEQDLPEWAEDEQLQNFDSNQQPQFSAPSLQMQNQPALRAASPGASPSGPVHPKEVQGQALSNLGEQFRRVMVPVLDPEISSDTVFIERTDAAQVASMAMQQAPTVRSQPATTLAQSGHPSMNQGRAFNTGEVKRVVFPKVDLSKNLG